MRTAHRKPAGPSTAGGGPLVTYAPEVPPVPRRFFRVEGLGRKGAVKFVKVAGVPGEWRISGSSGLRVTVAGRTVQEALRIARREIPFRPVVVREVPTLEDLHAKPF